MLGSPSCLARLTAGVCAGVSAMFQGFGVRVAELPGASHSRGVCRRLSLVDEALRLATSLYEGMSLLLLSVSGTRGKALAAALAHAR